MLDTSFAHKSTVGKTYYLILYFGIEIQDLAFTFVYEAAVRNRRGLNSVGSPARGVAAQGLTVRKAQIAKAQLILSQSYTSEP